MELEALRGYLLEKPGTDEGFPFGPDVAVFKVMGKMFALTAWAERPLKVNLKCEPAAILILEKENRETLFFNRKL